jgi:hypothetical protein
VAIIENPHPFYRRTHSIFKPSGEIKMRRPISCLRQSPAPYTWQAILVAVGLFAFVGSCPVFADKNDNEIAPFFQERLTGAEYQTRFDAAAKLLADLEPLAGTDYPVAGLRFAVVEPEREGYRLGIRVGDVAVRLNGNPLWNHSTFPNGLNRSLDFYSAASRKLKTTKLPPGRIGVTFRDSWRPELAYLRSKTRNAKWDREVLVGLANYLSDPDLSETAWHQAIKKGYIPDVYCAATGISLAFTRSDLAIATKCRDILQKADPKTNIGLAHPALLYRVAMANGELKEMAALAKKHNLTQPVAPTMLRNLLEKQEQDTGQKIFSANFSKEIETYVRDDQAPRLVGHFGGDVDEYLPLVINRKPFKMEPGDDRWTATVMAPADPIENLDVKLKVTWTTTPPTFGFKGFTVSLIDNQSPTYEVNHSIFDSCLLTIAFSATPKNSDNDESAATQASNNNSAVVNAAEIDLVANVDHSQIPDHFQFPLPPASFGPGSAMRFHLTKIGPRARLCLNDCPIIDCPVYGSSNNLALAIATFRSSIQVEDVIFDELIEDQRN